jgi:hypothetical protein
VLLEAYRGVPQCLEADVRILGLLWSRSRPFPSIFVLIVVLEWLSFLPFRILFSTLCPEFVNTDWFLRVPSPPTQFTIRSHSSTPRYITYAFWKDHYHCFLWCYTVRFGWNALLYTQRVYFIMHYYHITFGRGINSIAEKHRHTVKIIQYKPTKCTFSKLII